jgi:hypothetical protein
VYFRAPPPCLSMHHIVVEIVSNHPPFPTSLAPQCCRGRNCRWPAKTHTHTKRVALLLRRGTPLFPTDRVAQTSSEGVGSGPRRLSFHWHGTGLVDRSPPTRSEVNSVSPRPAEKKKKKIKRNFLDHQTLVSERSINHRRYRSERKTSEQKYKRRNFAGVHPFPFSVRQNSR